MKKFSVVALAMTATLALGACSVEDEPEEPTAAEETTEDTADETGDATSETGDAAEETGDAAGETGEAATYSEPACQEFFTEGGPLADRAEAARAALDAGEVTDQVSYSEIVLLTSRLDATAKEAPEDISALILEVNAPFSETVAIVNEGSEDVVDPEAGTITLPEIDTQASADAQAELETVCAG